MLGIQKPYLFDALTPKIHRRKFTFSVMQLIPLYIYGTALMYNAALIYYFTRYVLKLHTIETKIYAEPHDLNIHKFCQTYNKWIIRKLYMDIYFDFLFLLSGSYIIFTIYTPMIILVLLKLHHLPKDCMGLFDSTFIYNVEQLRIYIKDTVMFLNYHVLCYFIFSFYIALTIFSIDLNCKLYGVPH